MVKLGFLVKFDSVWLFLDIFVLTFFLNLNRTESEIFFFFKRIYQTENQTENQKFWFGSAGSDRNRRTENHLNYPKN